MEHHSAPSERYTAEMCGSRIKWRQVSTTSSRSTIPPSTPGDQTPNEPSRYPPSEGLNTRVKLSSAAERPSVPPTSLGATALLKALLISVLNEPTENAIGANTPSSTDKFGANAHPSSLRLVSATITSNNRSSSQRLTMRPTRTAWTNTSRMPTYANTDPICGALRSRRYCAYNGKIVTKRLNAKAKKN